VKPRTVGTVILLTGLAVAVVDYSLATNQTLPLLALAILSVVDIVLVLVGLRIRARNP